MPQNDFEPFPLNDDGEYFDDDYSDLDDYDDYDDYDDDYDDYDDWDDDESW